MKKVIMALLLCIFICKNVSAAGIESIIFEDGRLSITGVSGSEDAVSIIVSNEQDEIIYIDESDCGKNSEFSFDTKLEQQSGIKIKVGNTFSDSHVFTDFLSDKNEIYVADGGNDANSGSAMYPLKTLGAAIEKAEENGKIVIEGKIKVNEIATDKIITISGGKINVSDVGDFKLTGNITFSNVEFITDSNQKFYSEGKITMEDNIEFSNKIIFLGNEVTIKSGEYASVCADTVYLYNGAKIDEIKESEKIAFLNGADYSESIGENCNIVIKSGMNGTVRFINDSINVLPDDKRAYRVNDEEYSTNDMLQLPTGTYTIEYAYDFKINSAKLQNNILNISVDAFNLNKTKEKNNPVVFVATYLDKKLVSVKSKILSSNGAHDISFEVNTKNTDIKVFMLDSFERLQPLTDYFKYEQKAESIKEVYVSPDGNDENSGTIGLPLKTIAKAVEKTRGFSGEKVVYLRGGTYNINERILILSADNNLTIKPYNGEKVVLTTALKMSGSRFFCLGEAVKTRIIDDNAKDKVRCVVLSTEEKAKLSYIMDYDHNAGAAPEPIMSINDEKITLAKYPNFGYNTISTVITNGEKTEGFKITSDVDSDRIKQWEQAEDIVIRGFINNNWANAAYKGSVTNGIFTSENPYKTYPPAEGGRIRFTNLLEEIDMPGEWYADVKNGLIYLYPTENFTGKSNVTYTSPNGMDSLMYIENVNNVLIEDIEFKEIGTVPIQISGSENIKIDNCVFDRIISYATINCVNCKNCIIENNTMRKLSAGGIFMNGGDSESLEKGNNIIKNNLIDGFSEERKTYTPAIRLSGVGNVLSHNEITDSSHVAIEFSGQMHVMEYNIIKNVCNDTSDSGAIYSGRSWTNRGNVIRYNYFEDITKRVEGYSVNCVYMDDCSSDAKILGNVFYNIDTALLIGGGRNNEFTNNIVINALKSVYVDSRAENEECYNSLYSNLMKIPYYCNDVWKKTFPYASNILEDEPRYPKYNVIKNNCYFDAPEAYFIGTAEKYATNADNIVKIGVENYKNAFLDFDNRYFLTTNINDVINIKDFEQIPFHNCGREKE